MRPLSVVRACRAPGMLDTLRLLPWSRVLLDLQPNDAPPLLLAYAGGSMQKSYTQLKIGLGLLPRAEKDVMQHCPVSGSKTVA